MPELKINLQPSRLFIFLFTVTVIASVAIIFYLSLSWLIFPIAIYAGYILWNFVLLQSKNSITGLHFHNETWYVLLDGNYVPALLCKDSTVTKWVSVLRFKLPNKWFKQSCIIWLDSLDPETYRQLTVTARWSGSYA